jgi:hypothetical protein
VITFFKDDPNIKLVYKFKSRSMKSYLIFLSFLATSLMVNYRDISDIKARIGDYNDKDTINVADFLEQTEISLSSKEYLILNFTFFYSDRGYDYEIFSNSNKITDEMKKGISGIKNKDAKIRYIAFKKITVQTPQKNKIVIGNLAYCLK